MSQVVLIQGSLNKESRTAILVDHAVKEIKRAGLEVTVLDLRNIQMEFCDGRSLKEYHLEVQQAYQAMEEADAFVIGMPVYCYSVSGPHDFILHEEGRLISIKGLLIYGNQM